MLVISYNSRCFENILVFLSYIHNFGIAANISQLPLSCENRLACYVSIAYSEMLVLCTNPPLAKGPDDIQICR